MAGWTAGPLPAPQLGRQSASAILSALAVTTTRGAEKAGRQQTWERAWVLIRGSAQSRRGRGISGSLQEGLCESRPAESRATSPAAPGEHPGHLLGPRAISGSNLIPIGPRWVWRAPEPCWCTHLGNPGMRGSQTPGPLSPLVWRQLRPQEQGRAWETDGCRAQACHLVSLRWCHFTCLAEVLHTHPQLNED